MTSAAEAARPPLRFSRPEWSGAFGDVGTDLPLLLALLAATGLAAGPVFFAFGVALILSGWIYRLPMPVQPLKAMAVVVIAGQANGEQLQLAGLLLGTVLLVLAATGALNWLARVIPLWAVRGVQAGLALNLALAAARMIGREGWAGWIVGALALGAIVLLRRSARWPVGLLLMGVGLAWVWPTVGPEFAVRPRSDLLSWPALPWAEWPVVLVLLVLPQLPLSLSNSLVATERAVADFFPGRAVRIRSLGLTFAGLNYLMPFLGGVPVCHGCGGLAGHFALGARTGGSVVIYGAMFVLGGALGSEFFTAVARHFPFPLLGALLLAESAVLFSLARDQLAAPVRAALAAAIALLCVLSPYGYLVGLVAGTLAHHACRFALAPRNA